MTRMVWDTEPSLSTTALEVSARTPRITRFDDRRTIALMGSLIRDTAAAEPLGHPATGELELAAVLQSLSDPMRLRIVVALASADELSCKSIDLPVVKSTCTHHFRVL